MDPDRKRVITTRIHRPGDPPLEEDDWAGTTVAERIEAVWTLTLECLAWQGWEGDEPRLRDLLSAFNDQDVEYLVVGAHALAAHGHVRATKDLDVWVRPEPANAARVLAALRGYGAPLHGLTESDLASPGLIFQIGVPPIRIDVLTAIDGVEFEEAWSARIRARFADLEAAVISKEHLIRNKRAAGRLQDLAHIERLEQHSPTRRKA